MAIKEALTGLKEFKSLPIKEAAKTAGLKALETTGKITKIGGATAGLGLLLDANIDMAKQTDPAIAQQQKDIMLARNNPNLSNMNTFEKTLDIINPFGYGVPFSENEENPINALTNTVSIAKENAKDYTKDVANFFLPKQLEFNKTFNNIKSTDQIIRESREREFENANKQALNLDFLKNRQNTAQPVQQNTQVAPAVSPLNITGNTNLAPAVSPLNITGNTNLAGNLRSDLEGLNSFSPERNTRQLADRNLLSERLGKLFEDYDTLNQGGGDLASLLVRKGQLKGVRDQIKGVGSLVNSANSLDQSDINSANDLNFKNLESKRGDVLNVAKFGLDENNNNFRNDVTRETLPLTLENLRSNITGQNTTNQLNQMKLSQAQELSNAQKGIGFEVGSELSNKLVSTPGFSEKFQSQLSAKTDEFGRPLTTQETQQLARETLENELKIINLERISNLTGQGKSKISAVGDTETGGIKYTSNDPELVKKLLAEDLKQKSQQVTGT